MARTVGCARSRYRPVPTVFEYAEEGAWKKIAEFLQESVNDDNSQQSDQDDSDDEKEEEEDEEKQAKVNQALKGTGETLLMCAASGGSEKTVLQLIQHGADVHRVDKVRTLS